MKQYFMIETKKGVSKTVVSTALRIFLQKNFIKASYIESNPHTVANMEKVVKNRK